MVHVGAEPVDVPLLAPLSMTTEVPLDAVPELPIEPLEPFVPEPPTKPLLCPEPAVLPLLGIIVVVCVPLEPDPELGGLPEPELLPDAGGGAVLVSGALASSAVPFVLEMLEFPSVGGTTPPGSTEPPQPTTTAGATVKRSVTEPVQLSRIWITPVREQLPCIGARRETKSGKIDC